MNLRLDRRGLDSRRGLGQTREPAAQTAGGSARWKGTDKASVVL